MTIHGVEPSYHFVNLIGAFVTASGDELAAALERALGIGGSAPAALLAIDTWPDRSIDFLAGVLGLTHSGTVRLVDRMQVAGLVERRPGRDGRTTAVRATRRGKARVRTARDARREILTALARELDPEVRSALEVALERTLRARARSRTEARYTCRLCDHSVCRGEDCPVGASVE